MTINRLLRSGFNSLRQSSRGEIRYEDAHLVAFPFFTASGKYITQLRGFGGLLKGM